MYKLELKKKGKIIKSVDDWYNAASPKRVMKILGRLFVKSYLEIKII